MAQNPKWMIRESDGLTGGWGGEGFRVDSEMRFNANLQVDKTMVHRNASGCYVRGRNTVVKTADFAAGSTKIQSGAIYLPANSMITKLSVVVLENLTATAGTYGVKFGDSADSHDIAALVANAIKTGSTTTAAAKLGSSTDTAEATALQGAAPIVLDAGKAAHTAAVEIHGTVVASGGNFTAGKVAFIVEFIVMEQNTK